MMTAMAMVMVEEMTWKDLSTFVGMVDEIAN
jgi:hypothetical protein